jgi:T-complex protein 1 subunit alpha
MSSNNALAIGGSRVSGQEIRNQNGIFILTKVIAVQSVANIVKSSLGPVGLDKMIVDDIGVCKT